MHQDLDSIYDDYLQIREKIKKKLEGIPPDSEQAKFLHAELEIINQKLGLLQGLSTTYLQRYRCFPSNGITFSPTTQCFTYKGCKGKEKQHTPSLVKGKLLLMLSIFIVNRLSSLKALLQRLVQAEDIIKVHEARLTEKETSSLDPRELASYQSTLKVCHILLPYIVKVTIY